MICEWRELKTVGLHVNTRRKFLLNVMFSVFREVCDVVIDVHPICANSTTIYFSSKLFIRAPWIHSGYFQLAIVRRFHHFKWFECGSIRLCKLAILTSLRFEPLFCIVCGSYFDYKKNIDGPLIELRHDKRKKLIISKWSSHFTLLSEYETMWKGQRKTQAGIGNVQYVT